VLKECLPPDAHTANASNHHRVDVKVLPYAAVYLIANTPKARNVLTAANPRTHVVVVKLKYVVVK